MATNRTFQLPYDPLTALDPNVQPSPRVLRVLRNEVYANVAAITSTLGGGNHSHLGMIMPTAEYIGIAEGGSPYIAPERPQIPNYTGTAATIAAQREHYQEDMAAYLEHRDLNNQIKKLILCAVPHTYLSELADPDLGFSTVSPQQMMAHLVANYGKITHKDLIDNLEQLQAKWNPDTPIEGVFTNGNFCRKFAAEGNDPISDTAYVCMLVKVFDEAGVLEKVVEEWERKPIEQQTLTNATQHFKQGNQFRLTREAKATKTVLAAQAAISTRLKEATSPVEHTGATGLEGYFYCWSHGICKHDGHTCTTPREGHCKEATLTNRKGGSTWIQGITSRKSRFQTRSAQENTPQTST